MGCSSVDSWMFEDGRLTHGHAAWDHREVPQIQTRDRLLDSGLLAQWLTPAHVVMRRTPEGWAPKSQKEWVHEARLVCPTPEACPAFCYVRLTTDKTTHLANTGLILLMLLACRFVGTTILGVLRAERSSPE